jgi:predicted lipoprotein with Yx(FWY)xxD motif
MNRISTIAALLVVALAGAAVALGGGNRVHVVTTAQNAKLGKTVLVNLKGRTLYHLSVEHKGHFICTDKTCLSFWAPLVVKAGATPTGAEHLGTVTRPDGRHQVSYEGEPLYTFTGDHARGQANGEGFKDVGTWHAVGVGKGSGSGTTTPTTTSGGYGGYGY